MAKKPRQATKAKKPRQTKRQTAKPKKPRGRPPKARGAPASSDKAQARWTVRGVPTNVRSMAVKAADNKQLNVGDWIAEAIISYARSDKGGLSADGENLPSPLTQSEVVDTLQVLNERLTMLEQRKRFQWLKRMFGGA